jgi:hypothetical protein
LPRNPRVNIYESLWAWQKTKLPLALKLWYKTPQGHIGHVALLFIARPRNRRSPRPPNASHAIPPLVRQHRSFSARPDPVSACRASDFGFVAQLSNPAVLWWTAANPACRLRSWAATLHWLQSTTSSCFSCHHAARTWPRWPPGPSSRAYLSLHSSEALQGIDLSHSLLTYTNANQAATCTCNTRPRVSPHHVVNHSSRPGATIHRSSDTPVLNLPLDHWQHTQVTNSEKREKEKKRTKNSNKWSKAKQKPRNNHLGEKNLGPLRQGQWLDTTEIKCSRIADSSRWGKRARHHRQKSTTRIQAKKSSQKHECQSPLNKCISPNFSSLDANTPPVNMNWVLCSPLLVMHESSLQMQACASQIYKEHYNMLKVRHRQPR